MKASRIFWLVNPLFHNLFLINCIEGSDRSKRENNKKHMQLIYQWLLSQETQKHDIVCRFIKILWQVLKLFPKTMEIQFNFSNKSNVVLKEWSKSKRSNKYIFYINFQLSNLRNFVFINHYLRRWSLRWQNGNIFQKLHSSKSLSKRKSTKILHSKNTKLYWVY